MKFKTAFLLTLTLCFSALASAEIKIGLIDVRAALFASNSAKAFGEQLVKQFKKQDMEVRAVQEAGKKLETRLKNDSAIMSDSERAQLTSELDEKIQEFKYLKGKLDSAIGKRRQTFLNSSKPKLDKVINEIVKEEKLDLLLARESAMYAVESLDYTAKVIAKLNKLK